MIKLMHLSDLHLGKIVNEVNMLDDQKYILEQIIAVIHEEKPNAVLIAGDIYDRAVPSAEAVELYDSFITTLAELNMPAYIISGNHDSPERLACCNRLIERSNIYVDGIFGGKANKHILTVGGESVNIYTLPFIKPANARIFYGDEINSYTEAVEAVLKNSDIDKDEVNILVAHQYVTGKGTAIRSDSENISVGGTDNVDASAFKAFDYVALGHLHRLQSVGKNIFYCGTPLKYSESECNNSKNIIMVEMNGKKNSTRQIPLTPLRDMRTIKGTLQELTENPVGNKEDYVFAVLTDEIEPTDAMGLLRNTYPNILSLRFENKRSKAINEVIKAQEISNKTPLELFEEFYMLQNNTPLNEEQAEIINSIFKDMEGQVL